MEDDNRSIPLYITRLIVGFFQKTLTTEEHDKLDEWIEASEDNIEVFEQCLEMAQRPPQPQEIDLDNESTWLLYIIDLIIKKLQGTISEDEIKALEKWAASSERNQKLLEELPQTNDLKEVYLWLEQRFNREHLN